MESVQRRFSRFIGSLGSMTYAERLNILNADSLEVRRLKFDLVMNHCSVHGLNALDFFDFILIRVTPVHVAMLLNLVNIVAVLTVVLLVLQIVLSMCGTV